MRHKLVLPLFLAVFLVWSNSARAEDAAGPELISYSQLMTLSIEKRVEYFQGLQNILIELSKNKDGRFSDRDPKTRSRMKAMIERIDREMKSAKADEASASAPQTCKNNPKCRLQAARCWEKNQSVKWNSTDYVCDLSTKIAPELVAKGYIGFNEQIQKTDPQFGSTSEVAPPATRGIKLSPAAVDPAPSEAAVAGVTEPIVEKSADSLPIVLGPVSGPSAKRYSFDQSAKKYENAKDYINSENVDLKNYGCRSGLRTQGGLGVETQPLCSAAQEEALGADFRSRRTAASWTAARSSVPADSAAQPASNVKARNQAEAVPNTTAVAAADSAPHTEPTGKDYGPKVLRSTVQELLAQKKAPNDLCLAEAKKQGTGAMDLVAIGNDYRCMTKSAEQLYDNKKLIISDGDEAIPESREVRSQKSKATSKISESKTAAGKIYACAPKLQVCEDSKSWREKAFAGDQKCVFAGMFSTLGPQNRRCEPVTEFKLADKTLRCDSGQTMCNPLLFGVVSSIKPICVGRGSNATEMCASPKMSSPRDAEKFINQNVTGLVERWNEFKTNFAATCAPESPSAKFHCVECNIIQARIFELNAKILFDPCASRLKGTDGVDSRVRIRNAYPDSKSGKTGK